MRSFRNESGTVTKMRSLGDLLGARARPGRFTSTPRCIIGAVTMKMMSSTSITSTSGTTLISASVDAARGARAPAPPAVTASIG